MRGVHASRLAAAIVTASLAGAPSPAAAQNTATGVIERGAYIFAAAGCAGCHTDYKNKGQLLAGGRALKTPFGTFYGPNITPDPVAGIGAWSDGDFIRALREGLAPDGSHYYPAFPYPAFTKMLEADMLDLKAFIFSLPPSGRASRAHDLAPPFGFRFLLAGWKALNFSPGPLTPDPSNSAPWNRGAYLVRAVVHCSECHTPRTLSGGLDNSMAFAGSEDGPEGEAVPNITPDAETGIGDWDESDIAFFLELGLTPDGDVPGGLMYEVIERSTGKLTADDRKAISIYIKRLAPMVNKIAVKRKP